MEDEDRNELEATELRNYEDTAQSGRRCSTGVANSAGTNDGGNERLQEPRVATRGAAKIFWNRHVVATVSHDACRDHFGTCENLSVRAIIGFEQFYSPWNVSLL